MQKVKDFFKLIRWPNLVFIVFTQAAFYYFVLQTLYVNTPVSLKLNNLLFALLVIASVFIAAAGYIINDYFDINIDLINKPGKMVVGKTINRRYAILWHFILSFIGIVLSFYVSNALNQHFWWLGFSNLLVVLLLVGYSSGFKKQLLTGNIIISFLTAWVIIVLIMSQYQLNFTLGATEEIVLAKENFNKLLRIGFLYAAFAFMITLIREVVKDMEDFIGDARNGCKTMPIVWGFQVSKVFVAVWTIVLIALVIVLQFYVLQYQWFVAIVYSIVLILLPLLFSMKVLVAAIDRLHYHTLSNIYKFIMFMGILSMLFFKIYA
jgi:4-hydroxybenzoate polyprenyltransferase